MAILAALFAAVGRQAGRVLTTALGWASALLFGRVPRHKQLLLSTAQLGSGPWSKARRAWPLAALAVAVSQGGGSARGPAAVGGDDGSVDVRGLCRGQPGDQGGNLVRVRHTAGGGVDLRQTCQVPFRPGRGRDADVRFDSAGAYGVATNPLGLVGPGDVPRVADDGVLGGRVGNARRTALEAPDRGHVHDGAGLARHHRRQDFAPQTHRAGAIAVSYTHL